MNGRVSPTFVRGLHGLRSIWTLDGIRRSWRFLATPTHLPSTHQFRADNALLQWCRNPQL